MCSSRLRCFGNGNPLYEKYHDEEWGVAVHDDRMLFEMLILEGAQAGLSWETVLNKRVGYRQAFHDFDIEACIAMTDHELESLRQNPDIIRNRLKIYSVRKNAIVFRQIQEEFGSFSKYLWSYVDDAPMVLHPKTLQNIRITSPESDALSKDLKKRGMSFVGSTIMYAYMQAVGMVQEHLQTCWKSPK